MSTTDHNVQHAFHQIVGTARSRSIDLGDRVRDYNAHILGGRNTDIQNIRQLLSPLTVEQKEQLWQLLKNDLLEQSNWKIYELRFLMRLFDIEELTIFSFPPKQIEPPTFDDDIQDIELGDTNEY